MTGGDGKKGTKRLIEYLAGLPACLRHEEIDRVSSWLARLLVDT